MGRVYNIVLVTMPERVVVSDNWRCATQRCARRARRLARLLSVNWTAVVDGSTTYFLVVKSISLGLYPPSEAFSQVQAPRTCQ